MVRLLLLKEGRAAHAHVMDRLTNIGRGPGNDLVLVDPTVSWNHATLWLEGDTLWIRDLTSTNGTWVNGRRLTAQERLSPGDRLRFGTAVDAVIESEASAPVHRDVLVEDLASGVSFPLRSDRFVIGGHPDSDLHIPGAPEEAATLIIHPGGEVWLGLDEEDYPIQVGDEFAVAGRKLVLREVPGSHTPTIASSADRYPYRLSVDLDGATGPVATLTNLAKAFDVRIDAGNRAVLLYLLGRRRMDDLQKGIPDTEAGWCSIEEVQSGIWGKQGDDNKMHVLIYRLRGELKKAGFDPWFIEKRQRFVRARAVEIIVAEPRG
jgi:hypothetical protein